MLPTDMTPNTVVFYRLPTDRTSIAVVFYRLPSDMTSNSAENCMAVGFESWCLADCDLFKPFLCQSFDGTLSLSVLLQLN